MPISPSFSEFAAGYRAGHPQVAWTTLVADLETPVSAMLKLGASAPNAFLLESVEGGAARGRYSVIGLEPDVIWRCRGTAAEINRNARRDAAAFEPCPQSPLTALRALVAESRINLPPELPPMASALVGYVGYDMVRLMERLPESKADVLGVPDALFMRPTVMVVFDSVRDTMTLITPVWPQAETDAQAAYAQAETRLGDVVASLERPLLHREQVIQVPQPLPEPESNTTRAEYYAIVERAKEYIRAGDIFQVVPSQRFHAPFSLAPFALYRALRRLNPSPFLLYFNFGDFSIVGSSPEILVRVRDGAVTIRPIAGTRPRGRTTAEDHALEQDLLQDPKELAEHLMLLDLGRNDVGRVARAGTVRVTEQFVIERYSHVMHICSNVEGELAPEQDAVSALVAGFPAGTVSGAPKIRAMEIINELEKEKRGVYAGGVGYFAADGSMDTCIALRTAVLKDGIMYVQAGGGVVADSDSELEYQETVNKARGLFRAAEEAIRFASTPARNL